MILKKINGYITDSLGWALFKTKEFCQKQKKVSSQVAIMYVAQETL